MTPYTLQRWFIVTTMMLLVASAGSAHASAMPTRIPWQKIPIPVELSVGEERLLHFPGPVSVGMPSVLESVLRTQSVNGTVYLRANSPFAAQRVLVRDLDDGQVYLIDLSAAIDRGSAGPVTIYREISKDDDNARGEADPDHQHGYVSLTRFAAQQLYAPTRLMPTKSGIVRVPLQRQEVPLMRGAAVTATPLASWRAGELYVTAVKLHNRTKQGRTLDPRALRGQWLAATFQHSRLLPQGDAADTTAVYLVSSAPFDRAW